MGNTIKGDRMDSRPSAGIARVNDIEMHYDTWGAGEPLILLHGGGGAAVNWRLIFKEPPAEFQLIMPDLRGHGRTLNPSSELTFRQASRDVLALVDSLGIGRFR